MSISKGDLSGFGPFAIHTQGEALSADGLGGYAGYREDLKTCAAAIRKGSKSFHIASLMLPARTRQAALALYAFCRHSDDVIDDARADQQALGQLRERLRLVYDGTPAPFPCDRAFAKTVELYSIPKCVPDALLDGFAMDIANRRYQTIDQLKDYATCVAATVGLMMALVMRTGDPHALARAADLGIAMQLTNIARDVGEDARNGRLYLPLDWMEEAGLGPETFLKSPRFTPQLGQVVKRLLEEADHYYRLGHAGIAALPESCRHAIRTAALVYEQIGAEIVANGYDSVSQRAHTSLGRKVSLLVAARSPADAGAAHRNDTFETVADRSARQLVGAAAESFSRAAAGRSLLEPDPAMSSGTERFLCLMIRLQRDNRDNVRFQKMAARQRAASLL